MELAPKLAIVVPCYNETAVLPTTAKQLLSKLATLLNQSRVAPTSFILFVDDGSNDSTWELILTLATQQANLKGIKLSRNFGHQAALLCGLHQVTALVDCAISLDADLQDSLDCIDDFLRQFQAGHDVVYGVRKQRHQDSFFKRTTALAFYRLMQMLGTTLLPNHADYRLLSRRALQQLAQFEENNLFLRGIIPLLGFNSCCVFYARQPRLAGVSKYPLLKMLSLALNGIFSLSTLPLRLVNLLSLIGLLCSGYLVSYLLFNLATLQQPLYSWLLMQLLVGLLGSFQLIGLSFLGEYLRRIYHESKARPRYITVSKNR